MNKKSTLSKYISFYQANPNAFLQDILEIKLPFFKRAAMYLTASRRNEKSRLNLSQYILNSDLTDEQKAKLFKIVWGIK